MYIHTNCIDLDLTYNYIAAPLTLQTCKMIHGNIVWSNISNYRFDIDRKDNYLYTSFLNMAYIVFLATKH